jgi:hypothetical protein
MRTRGVRSVEAAVEAVAVEFDMPETDIPHARRGDLALVRNGHIRQCHHGTVGLSLTGRNADPAPIRGN